MTMNLPPAITVNKNLASTLRNYIKSNGGKNVSETEMNAILQKVAKFDAERDAGVREGGSIFSGGNKYLGGSGKDFQVQQGQQIQLSREEFNEVFKGYLDAIGDAPTPAPIDDKPVSPSKLDEAQPPKHPDKIDNPKGAQPEAVLDNVDGKVLEREVNGEKTKISVATVDGEKVRRVINEDGSLGDTLVPVSTAGKNKYITQTEMDNRMRTALGLGENEEIPKDIKGSFVSIGGTPTLIFKQDGKTMDQAQLREYVKNLHSEETNEGNMQSAEPAIEAPVTGPKEGENPAYDAAVRGEGVELEAKTNPEAPVTGPEEGENPEYDAAVLGEGVELEAKTNPEAPVTGPKEGENPAYDVAVRGEGVKLEATTNPETPVTDPLKGIKDAGPVEYAENDTPVEYNYENDKTYQALSSEVENLQDQISKFEKENNIDKNDLFHQADAMRCDGYLDYSSNQYLLRTLNSDLNYYKDIMDNWQDGEKFESVNNRRVTNGHTLIDVHYTNVERITLKNGERAYKTDQGTFYPYQNGGPGNKPVPEELLK